MPQCQGYLKKAEQELGQTKGSSNEQRKVELTITQQGVAHRAEALRQGLPAGIGRLLRAHGGVQLFLEGSSLLRSVLPIALRLRQQLCRQKAFKQIAKTTMLPDSGKQQDKPRSSADSRSRRVFSASIAAKRRPTPNSSSVIGCAKQKNKESVGELESVHD